MKNISTIFVSLFTVLTISCFGQVRSSLIGDFTPAQRTTLVDLMQQYITVQIIENHCDYVVQGNEPDIHDDFNFMPFHRVYMEGMEDFLILNGHPEFVPLPYWDPSTPTPIEFQVVDTDCTGTDCNINVGDGMTSTYCSSSIVWHLNDPLYDLPNYLKLPIQGGNNNDICDHNYSPTVPGGSNSNGLSRKIESPYHDNVHRDMKGNMGTYASPASPIFWCWHAFLDDLWKKWECNCPQSTTSNVDLYLKDNTYVMQHIRDRGEEPVIESGSPFPAWSTWESGDIWVRNQPDGFSNNTSQDAEYIATVPVYVYVRVRNRGCQPSTGNEILSLHWGKGASPLTWPNYWNGTTIGYALMGDLISTQTIPIIAPQSSAIMEFQWFPPNPNLYNENNSNPSGFSLLARQVSTNDPMTFTEVSNVETNIKNNNNIAWKNIDVLNNSVLPIELASFSGKRIRDEIQLSWQTVSEIQNKGFEIYRSSNASSWEKIGWVDGNGTSTQQHFYLFDDTKPAGGINYYRLKQIDFDGAFEYSELIAIENDHSDFDIRVFPNPSNSNFNILINNPLSQRMKVQINDNLGRKIWESNWILEEPNWRKELDIEKNGVYLITVQLGNEIYYERIVILSKS